MRPIEIEFWVLRIVDQVRRTSHCEDSLVELKRQWPPAEVAARQIAAHANAAHGAPILWVVGIDESTGVVGADPTEVANWLSSVKSHFNQTYPALQDLNVSVGNETVVAMLFQTDRAPYLVRNPAFGRTKGDPVEWEVPWREGRKTRSSTREDLLRLIAPYTKLPEIEWLRCVVYVREHRTQDGALVQSWNLTGAFYVIPYTPEHLVVPFHRCRATMKLSDGIVIDPWPDFRLYPPIQTRLLRDGGLTHKVDSLTVEASSHEAIVSGPGCLKFDLSREFSVALRTSAKSASVSLRVEFAGSNVPCVVESQLVAVLAVAPNIARWTRVDSIEPDSV